MIETAGGTTRTGPLQELAADWSVRLGGDKVAGADLLELRRAGKRIPPKPAGEQLLFANGDCLPGSVVELAGERVRFRPELTPSREFEVSLDALAAVWRTAPVGVEKPNLFRRQLAVAGRTRDRVLLQNGDVVEGILKAITKDAVEVEADKKTIAVGRDKLAAVVMSSELANSLRPKGPYGGVVLDDGTRLSLLSCEYRPGGPLTAKTLFGATVQLPAEKVIALTLFQGKAVYLSDLKPSSYEFTPYLDVRWREAMDGSVLGNDLVLAGSVYDKGIGLHSASRLRFNLNGEYRRFEALVGLDGPGGSARVQVLVDGKPQPFDGNDELSDPAVVLPIKVKVAGARTLTLVVDYGRRGDVLGRVNWVNARVVK